LKSQTDLLESRFLNGRYRTDSCLKLTAHWIDGWKLKDRSAEGKSSQWTFEEEVILGHVEEAIFRCRVHLYAYGRPDFPGDYKESELRARAKTIVPTAGELDKVRFEFSGELLEIVVHLDLEWGETDNPSKNPKIFRTTGLFGINLKPIGDLTLELLITYRNLGKIFRSERCFERNGNGFRWVGRPTSLR